MILETIRIVKDALQNITYGVNAQLASLDIDSGDTVPTNIVAIGDETIDFLIALDRPALPFPSLSVALDSQVELDPEVLTSHRDGEVTLMIRVALSNDQAQNGMRDTYYYLRAVQKVLRDLGSNDNAADRVRNGICVNEMLDMTHQPAFKQIDDANGTVTAQLRITYRVRDTNP